MEIKEVASSPFLYATIASLAVLIIGALAYQKIGLLSNCAPVTGIIMMSVGAGILFFEGIIFGCKRQRPVDEIQFLEPQGDEIQIFLPDDTEQHCTMSLQGDRRLPFILLNRGQREPKSDLQKFCIWTQPSVLDSSNFLLWIICNTDNTYTRFVVGNVKDNEISVSENNQNDRTKFLALKQKHQLTFQPFDQ